MRMRCNTTLLQALGGKFYTTNAKKKTPLSRSFLSLDQLFYIDDLVLLLAFGGLKSECVPFLLFHKRASER